MQSDSFNNVQSTAKPSTFYFVASGVEFLAATLVEVTPLFGYADKWKFLGFFVCRFKITLSRTGELNHLNNIMQKLELTNIFLRNEDDFILEQKH